MATNLTLRLTEKTEVLIGTGTVPVVTRKIDRSEVGVKHHEDRYREIATGVTDDPVDLGGITTIKFIRLVSDQTLKIRFATAGTEVQTKKLIWEGTGVTEFIITNDSGSAAKVELLIGGD